MARKLPVNFDAKIRPKKFKLPQSFLISGNFMNYDVIIIGGGAAGLSAGLWCAELGLRALLLESEKEFGGQLLRTYNRIENYLGIEAKNGRELRDIFLEQIKKREFLSKFEAEISTIDFEKKTLKLKTGESFSADFLIVATGVRRRKLNIEGEKKFQNKGILRSGKRDKDSVRDKNVIIVGGGDAALENALILAETARKVTLVHRREEFSAREEFLQKVRQNDKIEILTNTILTKISGGEKVENVELENLKNNESENLAIDAVLLRIGVEANAGIFEKQIDLDEKGYIKINSECETSVKNIFAIGDVANPLAPTISSAVGMGAIAAKVISARTQ